mmetsp:Transcript_24310/g.52667  ORF Transcript_24310/g.52667 Transcript_24310/m.52667 type:complete len:779 (-) Transcript_24310:222-2558(-)
MPPLAGDPETAPVETEEATASPSKTALESSGTMLLNSGTILEAAFVDPAYPGVGKGKDEVELRASTALLSSADRDAPTKMSVRTTETVTTSRCGFLQCCKNTEEQVVVKEFDALTDEEKKLLTSRKGLSKKEKARLLKAQEKARRRAELDKEKYAGVPEGMLIYRLDTAAHTVSLVSPPSAKTNTDTLVRHMVVAAASPGSDRSRKSILLTGEDGSKTTLTACEQRTAIAWMEAMEMMFNNTGKGRRLFGRSGMAKSKGWGRENLDDGERNQIEDNYVNLAAYSHNLIRAGAIPGKEGELEEDSKKSRRKNKARGAAAASGVYYSVTKHREEGDEIEEEALESIAKRRAVIKDSWDFYRMICSLLRDKRKYDEVFRKMTMDPVFPYLNSMTGLNDPGDTGYENTEKSVVQKDLTEYASMTRTQVVQDQVAKAEEALPSLVEICKALAGSLGMEEVGVGPVKEVSSAIRKAEKKYNGDVLKVTDYCRALLVVKDFPTLLALLELARDSFGPLIRRVKLSTLKADHMSLPGGYRDCKINLELKEHICEIQVHIWPMWVVCGVDGFRHYRHCLEYSTDSFADPYESLDGLDRKTVAELIVMAEEAVADMPLDSLEWYHEKYILDYFAEVGLFLKHGLDQWGETTLRELIRLRCESPDIGPDHHETRFLKKYLVQALQQQGKKDEARDIIQELDDAEEAERREREGSEGFDCFSFNVCGKEALEGLMDPNKDEREEEQRLKKEVKASKKAWRRIREERFKFLDASSSIDNRDRSTQSEASGY